jgi:hypothetical protein
LLSGTPLTITLVNNYPLGSVEVVNGELNIASGNFLGSNVARLELLFFGVDREDVVAANATAVVTPSDYHDDEGVGPLGGYYKLLVALNPPANAAQKCLGVRLRLTLAVPFAQFNISSSTASVIFTGSTSGLGLQQPFPSVYALNVATGAAPVAVSDVYADWRIFAINPPVQFFPVNFFPSVMVSTGSGSVLVDSVFSAGVRVASGTGNVRFTSVASVCFYQFAACGLVEGSTGGGGLIAFSQLLMGYGVKATTASGIVAMVNVAALVGANIDITSNSGAVFLNNLLQGAGNETRVTTRGKVSASATFVNRLSVNALDASAVSFAALFAGINFNSNLSFAFVADQPPIDLPLRGLFVPSLSDYAEPEVAVTSNWGDISVLSIGGNPASPSFANILSLRFFSMCVWWRAWKLRTPPRTRTLGN